MVTIKALSNIIPSSPRWDRVEVQTLRLWFQPPPNPNPNPRILLTDWLVSQIIASGQNTRWDTTRPMLCCGYEFAVSNVSFLFPTGKTAGHWGCSSPSSGELLEEQVLNMSSTELTPQVTLTSALPGYPIQFHLSTTLWLSFIFRGVQITAG